MIHILEYLPIGITFKTQKGFTFKKLGQDHWLDETSGIEWLPGEKTNITQYEAEKLGALPTKKQFEEAESHGIREVLDMKGKTYWSSTPCPGYPDFAYVLYGHDGDVVVYRSVSYDWISARCVSLVGGAPGVKVESNKCTCDFYAVVMIHGCKCGGK